MIKKYLVAFLIAMVPLIELRGAVPFGLSTAMGPAFSGVQQVVLLYVVAVIGNMLPVPFIFFFARKVLEWGKDKKIIGKFFTWCLEKVKKVVKNYKIQLEKVYIGLYSYLLEYHYQVQVHGLEH